MDQEKFGGQREVPTAAEIEFCKTLESLTCPPYFDFWLHNRDIDNSPWLLVSLTFFDEEEARALRTLRLDFDGAEIKGGWSPSNLNWDAEIPASKAEVEFDAPEGINKTADSTKELAAMAAAWFLQHYQSSLRTISEL